jgi:nicotinate-nucleotide adenylyltransferase
MKHCVEPSRKKPRRLVLPPYGPGLAIGLLGGSFNPPQATHRAVSLFAMKRLRLDRVWWVVSPGNPLKDTRSLPALAERMAAARALARHPRIAVTDIEAQIGTRYTIDTLRALRRRCPQVRFVWLAGADVLAEFHRWKEWQKIFRVAPIAFVDRDGQGLRALASPAARAFEDRRLPEAQAARLAACRPPAWTFLHGMKSAVSSTALRQNGCRRG